MKQKDLDKEGITKEYLSTLSVHKLGNPVQLLPNDEPATLLRCSKGFWVSVNGELLKDGKEELVVISEKEALIGRARYLLNFSDDIKRQKLLDEIDRLKSITDKELVRVVANIRKGLIYAGVIEPEGIESITIGLEKKHWESYSHNVEKAKKLVDDDTKTMYDFLNEQIEFGDDKNYDMLYSYLFQSGTYQLASFTNSSSDLKVLSKFFSKDNLETTIDLIRSKSHIENVARFNIEKNEQ